MGCPCKNKYKKLEKYADGGITEESEKKSNIFEIIFTILLQVIFGIFCGVVIIIMIIPMLLYIIGCLITGREASFKLKRFGKKN